MVRKISSLAQFATRLLLTQVKLAAQDGPRCPSKRPKSPNAGLRWAKIARGWPQEDPDDQNTSASGSFIWILVCVSFRSRL